uniref:SPASM domain-containing protein n=1 Tax=Meloidogyne hapla TaxID=6305 RepID=A0A1I8C192_MELHA
MKMPKTSRKYFIQKINNLDVESLHVREKLFFGPSQTLYGPVYNKGEICGNCEHNNCNKESGLCIPVINKLIID